MRQSNESLAFKSHSQMNNLPIILDIGACVIACGSLKSSQHFILGGYQLRLALERVICPRASDKTSVMRHEKLNELSYITTSA